VDEDMLYERARKIVSPLSWLIPSGIAPVYSEVMGRHRPYSIWTIAALTVLISIWFLGYQYSGSPKMRSMKNLMLWVGRDEPDPNRIELLYRFTNYGDSEAFSAKKQELKGKIPENKLDLAALKELNPEQQCFGQYRHTQLITHAFLHGSPLHLAGNMLFLLIFGSRVGSVIGNIWTVILYILLAIAAGLTHMIMSPAQAPTAMLGASGAVMGMAGVYLVLFPIHRIFMTAWWRWGLFVGFHLSFKVFAMRGFWVVLFYIFFDIVAVSLAFKSGTAHWAHIGGFICGITAGLILLVGKVAYSRTDILSLILGKYAWPLIGTPYGRG
jgi:membrane associated rhomboid family serine protease